MDQKDKILYFLGGEYYNKSNFLHKKVFQDISKKIKTIKLLIFPWTWKLTYNEYIKSLNDFFIKLGVRQIQFAEISDSKDLVLRKIKSANVLYFPGGDQGILIKQIKNKKLWDLLKNYPGIIVGNSAGTMVFSRQGIFIKYKNNKIIERIISSGLCLTNFSTAVHYNKMYDKELMEYSKNREIYALSEKSALIYESNKIMAIGKVYKFYKGQKTKLNP